MYTVMVQTPFISIEVFMPKLNKNAWALVEMALPWIMLLFLGYYTFSFFVIKPYTGVYIEDKKIVNNVYGPDQGENSLKQNDIIQRVGSVTYLDSQKNCIISKIRGGLSKRPRPAQIEIFGTCFNQISQGWNLVPRGNTVM